MKNLFKLILFCLLLGCSFPAMAQKFDPYKGEFVKEAPNYTYEANINLREKTIRGEGEDTGLCYGTLTLYNQRGVFGYDIIEVDSLESPEPNLWIKSWQLPEAGLIRVSIDYDATKRTITLNDWEGGAYIKDLTLKKR